VSDKPVPLLMAVKNIDSDPPEIINVWLTTPPSNQVVWAVGRTIDIDPSKPLLKSTVLDGLRQKYGPETDEQYGYWSFDQQGQPSKTAKALNCAIRAPWGLGVAPPQDTTYNYVTPLFLPLRQENECDSLVDIRASMLSPQNQQYVTQVTVTVFDLALARRSQEAVAAFVSRAADAKRKEELEKAKQRKAPVF